MRTNKVERVRGVSDTLPEVCEVDAHIAATLRDCFESFGYRPIEVPILEHTELFLRKSGEELIARMYEFTYYSRHLCLRPEMTASIVRAYVDSLEGMPLPIRLYYHGPVFRYEKPQRSRSRQFTQMGIELIGAKGVAADAEIVGSACKGLDRLGLTDYQVVMGHIGILNKFLTELGLESRLSNFLLAHMEMLREDGEAEVQARLKDIYPGEKVPQGDRPQTTERLVGLLRDMDETEARMAVLEFISSMNINLDGARQPEEIADRLLTKIGRQAQSPLLERALAFMKELSPLSGRPEEVLPEVRQVLAAHNIESGVPDHLQRILDLLPFYQVDVQRLHLDFGISRGLQYYTGTIFEIHHNSAEGDVQVCGGGRYDDLVAVMGGQKYTPATGFSYGMERLRIALEEEGKLPTVRPCTVHALTIPASAEEFGYACQVAETLRAAGLRVEMDVRDRKIADNFQYADKRGIPFAVVVGAEEARTQTVTLKNLTSGEQQQVALTEAASTIGGTSVAV